jgi:hypothetical protein
MPALNSILPADGKRRGVSSPELGTRNEPPAEKFLNVMERIKVRWPKSAATGSGSAAPAPERSENEKVAPHCLALDFGTGPSDLTSPSAVQSPKNEEGGKTNSNRTGADFQHGEMPPAVAFQSGLAQAADIPASPATTGKIQSTKSGSAVSSSAATAPEQSEDGKVAPQSPALGFGFGTLDSFAGFMPATARPSQILSAADSRTVPTVQAGQTAGQTDFPSAPAREPVDQSPPPTKSAPAGGDIELPEMLSLDDGENFSSHAPAATGSTPEAVPAMGETLQIKGRPATIIIKVGSSFAPVLNSDTAPSADGMTVAQQDVNVKMATKKTDFTGAAEQKLPGAAGVGTQAAAAPVRPGVSQKTASAAGENLPARVKNRGGLVSEVGTELPADAAAKTVLPEALNLPRLAPAGTTSLERTQEMMASQVVRLHESGVDELRVVIKPDAGLQLSLNLRQGDGVVEVRAVLDRGNFDLLNRHWPELQQQLESRGMRVAPLSCADENFGGGSEGFRQPTTPHGQHAGDDADFDSAPAEPAVLIPGLPTATATASASATLARNWETWA